MGGSSIDVFETSHGCVAIPICYDIYFPELFAAVALREPDILFFLAAALRPRTGEALLKARAMDTKAYIARASYGRSADQPWKRALCLDSRPLSIPTALC